MKCISVACGDRITTSTIVTIKIRERCEDNGIPVSAIQYKLLEVKFRADDFDLLVTAGKFMGGNVNIPVVDAISPLTGTNEDAMLNKLLFYLK